MQSLSVTSLPCGGGGNPRRRCPQSSPARGDRVPASASSFQAGLASPENSEQLVIALEPEAASIYCRKLRLHQLIELSSKTAVNGYSASDTVGAGFAQGTSALSLPLPAPPFTPASRMPLGLRLFKGTVRKNQTLPKRVGLSSSVLSCPFPIWPFRDPRKLSSGVAWFITFPCALGRRGGGYFSPKT